MLNEKKVILQTKAAIFEKREDRRALRINRCTKSDYISFHMLRNGLYMTLGYLTIVAWYVLYQAELLTSAYNLEQFKVLLYKMGIIYVIVLVVNALISLVLYSYRYQNARKECKKYRKILKKLKLVQENEADETGSLMN